MKNKKLLSIVLATALSLTAPALTAGTVFAGETGGSTETVSSAPGEAETARTLKASDDRCDTDGFGESLRNQAEERKVTRHGRRFLNADGSFPVDCWLETDDGRYYLNENGYMLQNSWLQYNRTWYYLGEDGILLEDALLTENDTTYYLTSDGILARRGWIYTGDSWYYTDDGGVIQKNTWIPYQNAWYYMDASGKMVEDDFLSDGQGLYYMYPDGIMASGSWILKDKIWYYAGKDGALLCNDWLHYASTWYYFSDKGEMKIDALIQSGEAMYYLNSDGVMAAASWLFTDGHWYYAGKDGNLTVGWQYVAGKWYYMNPDRTMRSNDWLYDNGRWYFLYDVGSMAADSWLYIDNVWYYAKSDGAIVTDSWHYVGNQCYYFNASGAMMSSCRIDGWLLGEDGAWIPEPAPTDHGGFVISEDTVNRAANRMGRKIGKYYLYGVNTYSTYLGASDYSLPANCADYVSAVLHDMGIALRDGNRNYGHCCAIVDDFLNGSNGDFRSKYEMAYYYTKDGRYPSHGRDIYGSRLQSYPSSDLIPGSVLVWSLSGYSLEAGGGAGHVAIYLGANRFAECTIAPNSSGSTGFRIFTQKDIANLVPGHNIRLACVLSPKVSSYTDTWLAWYDETDGECISTDEARRKIENQSYEIYQWSTSERKWVRHPAAVDAMTAAQFNRRYAGPNVPPAKKDSIVFFSCDYLKSGSFNNGWFAVVENGKNGMTNGNVKIHGRNGIQIQVGDSAFAWLNGTGDDGSPLGNEGVIEHE